MPYELPALPYAAAALEPHIDARTMEIHHGKHHAAYVTNVNKALEGHPNLMSKPIDRLLRDIGEVPDGIRPAVINNGGGHANHALFWSIMGPGKGGAPKGKLSDAIQSTFGSFEKLKEQVTQNGMARFGSGWSWMVVDGGGKLQAYSTPNQDSPYMQGHIPILGVDVWEHAYYLNYQNRRADYLAAWWNTVNWDVVNESFSKSVR